MSATHEPAALYEAPAGVSPALARLFLEGVYDDRVFAAALASLAVKGRIKLEEAGDGWRIEDGRKVAALSRGERALVEALFHGVRQFDLSSRHYLRFMRAREHHYDVVMAEAKPGFLAGAVRWLAGLGSPGTGEKAEARISALERYRTYLDVAVKDRADPHFIAGGRFGEIPQEMPYLIAFGLENSWGDRFVAAVASTVDGYAKSTSLTSLYEDHRRKQAATPQRRTRKKGYGNGRHGQEPWDTFEDDDWRIGW